MRGLDVEELPALLVGVRRRVALGLASLFFRRTRRLAPPRLSLSKLFAETGVEV